MNKLGMHSAHFEHVVGCSGGIWVLWKDIVQAHLVHLLWQAVTVIIIMGKKKWFFTIVYACPNPSSRRFL